MALERFPISRSATKLEGFCLDHRLWHVLLALHFAYKHYQDEGESCEEHIQACLELASLGILKQEAFIAILLYGITDNTKVTYQFIAKTFSRAISDLVEQTSRSFTGISELSEYEKKRHSKDQKLLPFGYRFREERYPLADSNAIFLERLGWERGFWKTLQALHYANWTLEGVLRFDGTKDITHSTEIACTIVDRRREEDYLLAKALLHDIAENALVPPDEAVQREIAAISLRTDDLASLKEEDQSELRRIIYYIRQIKEVFGKQIADDVDIMTKRPGLSLQAYYEGVERSYDASIIKAVDQENIVSTMIIIFSIKRLQRKVGEMYADILPFLKRVRQRYPEAKGLFFSCRRHIKSMMQSIEKYIKVSSLVIDVFSLVKELKQAHDAGDSARAAQCFVDIAKKEATFNTLVKGK